MFLRKVRAPAPPSFGLLVLSQRKSESRPRRQDAKLVRGVPVHGCHHPRHSLAGNIGAPKQPRVPARERKGYSPTAPEIA